MSEEIETLEEAVTEAVGTEEVKETEAKEVEERPEVKIAEKKEEAARFKSSLSEIDAQKAELLYQALSDPSQSINTVKALAAQIGLKIETPESKTESAVDETKSAVSVAIKKHLGKEYKFLATKVGNAFEEALDIAIDSRLTGIKQRLDKGDTERTTEVIDVAMQSVFGKYENSNDATLQSKIVELQEDFQVKPGTKPERYFQLLINAASADLGMTLIKKGFRDESRIKANRADAASRIASVRAGKEGSSGANIKPISLDAAVKAAIEKENEK